MIYLSAILTFGGLTVLLAAWLVISERFLINYGVCTVDVNDGETVFEYPGGSSLLSTLQENKIVIPSACAGKGSCGYCKVIVTRGGGPLLLTETPYLSRQERRNNVRLSCQVKVREDIDIHVPEFLDTVRDMVKNKTYNPRLKWKFLIAERAEQISKEKIVTELSDEDEAKARAILEEYKGVAGALVPVLQRLNGTFNYLSEPALRYVAEELDIPLSSVYRVATFYNAFSLTPKGRNEIKVCMGTACYVKGGQKIQEAVEDELGITVGENTEDLKFCLGTVSCIGCCGQSPVMSVNDEVYGFLKPAEIGEILEGFDLKSM